MTEDSLILPISFLKSQKDNNTAIELLKLWNIYKRNDCDATLIRFRKCSKCGIADGHNKATCTFIANKKTKKKVKKEVISDEDIEVIDIFYNCVKYSCYKPDNTVVNNDYVTVGKWNGGVIEWLSNEYEKEHKNQESYSVSSSLL